MKRFPELLLSLVICGYLFSTLPTLEWWPPLTYDECWISSVADTLVGSGRFATPVFGDFMGFDRLALDRLPAHSWIQAISLTMLGFGIWQMRLPSVLMGLGMIVAVFLTLRSWLGGKVAVLAAALMAFGPLCLSQPIWAPGISSISTSARHDITVGFFAAWSVWALLKAENGCDRVFYLWAGMSGGLALLTHPTALLLPVVFGVFWLCVRQRPWPPRGICMATGILVFAPWAVFLALNWELASRQFDVFNGPGVLSPGRFSFLDTQFYVQNFLQEGMRYSSVNSCIFTEPVTALVVVLAGAGVIRAARTTRNGRVEPHFLLVALPLASGCLALFESWKYSAYLILVLPFWMMAAAYGWHWLDGSLLPRGWFRRCLYIGLLVAFSASILSRYRDYLNDAQRSDRWGTVEEFLSEQVRPGATVVASLRFWPALRRRHAFFDYQTPTLRSSALSFPGQEESLAAWFERRRPDYLVFDDNWRKWAFELQTHAYSATQTREQFRLILDRVYEKQAERSFWPYGTVEIYKRTEAGTPERRR